MQQNWRILPRADPIALSGKTLCDSFDRFQDQKTLQVLSAPDYGSDLDLDADK